jgi:hypothetical protein
MALDLAPAPELDLLEDAVDSHLDVDPPVGNEDGPLVAEQVGVDLLGGSLNHQCPMTETRIVRHRLFCPSSLIDDLAPAKKNNI